MDDEESVSGLRLIIEGNIDTQHKYLHTGCETTMQIINILDGEYNNCILYKSKHIYYGHQKFFNDGVSFKESLRCYYLVLSAKFDPSYIHETNLDQCETLLVLKKVIKLLYKLVHFNFAKNISTNYDQYMERSFFMS